MGTKTTKTFVNIRKQPWNQYFSFPSGGVHGEAILEKSFAMQLAAVAAKEDGKFQITSALRTPKYNGGRYGSSHTFGESADYGKFIPNKGNKGTNTDKGRQAAIAAKYATGKDRKLVSGVRYTSAKYGAGIEYAVPSTEGKEVIITGGTDLVHLESLGVMALPPGLHRDNYANGLQSILKSNIGMAKDGSIRQSINNNKGDWTEFTVEVDDETKIPTLVGEVSYRKKGDAAGTALDKAKLTSMVKASNSDIDIWRAKVTIDDKPISVKNIGKSGHTTDAMNSRQSYKDSQAPTKYIKKTSYQLPNDDRGVTPSELGITNEMQDKRIKNCMKGFHPLGTLAKYTQSEQPASIRLVLDKLFSSERTAEAISAWKAYEASNVTYIDQFIMDRVSVQSKEAYRVVASLGEEYKVYFGTSSPEVLSISGFTINTANQQWLYDFKHFYEHYLKGSKLVGNRLRAFLTFTDAIYEVLPVSFSYSESSKIPGAVTISLDCIVLQWIPFGNYKNPILRGKKLSVPPKPLHSSAQTEIPDDMRHMLTLATEELSKSAGKSFSEKYRDLIAMYQLKNVPNDTYELTLDGSTGTTAGGVAVDTSKIKIPNELDEIIAKDLTDQVHSYPTDTILNATRSGELPDELIQSVQNVYNNSFELRGPA